VTPEIIGPIARVLLRYVGGALISAGVAISPGTLTDPDVIQVTCFLVGALSSAASECWYIIAKRNGWST
jgi:hypothetical protein